MPYSNFLPVSGSLIPDDNSNAEEPVTTIEDVMGSPKLETTKDTAEETEDKEKDYNQEKPKPTPHI